MLDEREEKCLEILTKKYQELNEPSKLSVNARKTKEFLMSQFPQPLQDQLQEFGGAVSQNKVWKLVMDMATDGFIVIQNLSAKYSINENSIVKKMKQLNNEVNSIYDIRKMKGYEIESIVSSLDLSTQVQSALQAAPSGFFGLPALAVNIIASTFIQFRTVQLIAMHYGYDVKNNPEEMEYASEVLYNIFMNGKINGASGTSEIISKMMLEAELTTLRDALSKYTFKEMAEHGGIQLLYAQIRAISNKGVAKAVDAAGAKAIENKALKNLLNKISGKMTKKAGLKAIPIISAVLSVLIDAHQINKILKVANVIYHKRFLIEKEVDGTSELG